ncbi:MAG: hypothetical protein WCG80_07040 [Spirochaetales bacterium]
MSLNNRLYMILFPNTALVGSQLPPDDFGRHFISGSSKYYSGKLIFAEIDAAYRHEYFNIDDALKDMTHADGRPKSTKYISTYRVLEHIEFSAILSLYITTPEGFTLPLVQGSYEATHQSGLIRIFGEIAPVSMMVLSDYNFRDFSKFITNPKGHVGAPKMFYTQIDLDIDEFLADFEANPLMQPPIPDIHPSVLRESVLDLRKYVDKHTKGLSLSNPLGKISFRHLRHGFMFASQEENKFYPLPAPKDIEKLHFRFWKTM